MHWVYLVLFLAAVEVTKNDAVPLAMRKRVKKLLEKRVGTEGWTMALPNGDNVEETANIAERKQKIIIRSNNVLDNSGLDNSTILLDFKKGVMAVLFGDADIGSKCFFTRDQSSFAQSIAEIKRRTNSESPVQQGDPIIFYALNNGRIMNRPSLLRVGGPAVFKLCGRSLENGNVYEIVEEATERMQSDTLTASGYISATQPGKSVPIIFKMQDNTTGGLESSSTPVSK